jgi:N-acetylglutamate synthase-like GNAT family acetyltransferase
LLNASYRVLLPSEYEEDILAEALPVMSTANASLLSSGTYYISVSDRQFVGCGGWTFQHPGSGDTEPRLAHIRHFATHPDWVGRGIGRSIYNTCSANAQSAGVTTFECYSSLNAVKFYAALGFKSVRPIEIPIAEGINLSAILMRRSI